MEIFKSFFHLSESSNQDSINSARAAYIEIDEDSLRQDNHTNGH